MRLFILVFTLLFYCNTADAAWIYRVPPQKKSEAVKKSSEYPYSKKQQKQAKSKRPSFKEERAQRDTLGMVMLYLAFILIAFGAFALLLTILPTVAGLLAGIGVLLLIAYLVFFVMVYA